MKKIYVNLVTLIIGIPLLFFALMVFLLMRLGSFFVPKSWRLSADEFWRINNWVDEKACYLHYKC